MLSKILLSYYFSVMGCIGLCGRDMVKLCPSALSFLARIWVECFGWTPSCYGISVVTREGTVFLMWLANLWPGILALIGCTMSRSYKEEQDERVALVLIFDCILWSLIVENIISILVLVKPASLTYNPFLHIS